MDKVCDSVFCYNYGPGSKSIRSVYCTEAESIEIRIQFEFYKELFKEETELLLEAFIQHHAIFGSGNVSDKELTEDEKNRMKRMFQMEAGLSNKSIVPLLETDKM